MDIILDRIIQRLSRIEAELGIAPNTPTDPTLDNERLSKQRVARRYGTTPRSIDREREKAERGESDFPLPEIVNGRCWWWLSTLQEYDRRRTADAANAGKPVPPWLRDPKPAPEPRRGGRSP